MVLAEDGTACQCAGYRMPACHAIPIHSNTSINTIFLCANFYVMSQKTTSVKVAVKKSVKVVKAAGKVTLKVAVKLASAMASSTASTVKVA